MAEIIRFVKPEEKSLEDKFIETLSLDQIEMFATIMMKASIDQDQREEKLMKEIVDLKHKLKLMEKKHGKN